MQENLQQDEYVYWSTLLEYLPRYLLEVKFTKRDGSTRTMTCTTSPEYLPRVDNNPDKPKRKQNDDVKVVWSVEDEGWRSIKKGSILSILAIERKQNVNG